MINAIKITTFSAIMCMAVAVSAQDSSAVRQKMNMLKTNLTGAVLRNYSLQYERVLGKHWGLAVTYRMMPTGSIPFKNMIINSVGDGDPETVNMIESLQMGNTAITPELRWYVGKRGYGRGFYIAPFYRYAKHEADNVAVEYTSDLGSPSTMNLSGSLVSNTGGLLFGAQWFLGKALVLDWWIFGPHYGSGKGDLVGRSSKPLSLQEQNDLRQELESIDIPMTEKTVYVDANGASVKLTGPWAGIRAGLSLGIRF